MNFPARARILSRSSLVKYIKRKPETFQLSGFVFYKNTVFTLPELRPEFPHSHTTQIVQNLL